jgi:hypothetical protein
MKRTAVLISILSAALLLTPGAAAPAAASSVDTLAAQTCSQEKKSIGRKAFTKRYGKGRKGMRSCIRRTRGDVRAAQHEAAAECAAELTEWGPEVFADVYGTDATGSDAMANCIEEAVDWSLDLDDGSGDDEGEEEEE